ncbi:Uncharacterised protein [Campylobacter hyointestinalis]|uniref:hypothetical protein n=1 Tax=Campylobacter hyointestinalis TaxID=198 RepID=UPI0007284B7A|nr:hypothetical protein [Campylobacter hyointestinalis]PPB56032.1 hypothetical protein CDQ67_02015 [Campylobacter hyointestinalis subsp. hyointestinalis]CUU86915.1 Uncharacterised protein [Campylobacter hyointestinalis]
MKIIRDVANNLTVDSQRELKFPYYEKIKNSFYVDDKYCKFILSRKWYLKNISDGDEDISCLYKRQTQICCLYI